MAVRDGPMIPMTTSGHCEFGPDHSKCHKIGCTCECHKAPVPADETEPRKTHRKRRKLL